MVQQGGPASECLKKVQSIRDGGWGGYKHLGLESKRLQFLSACAFPRAAMAWQEIGREGPMEIMPCGLL